MVSSRGGNPSSSPRRKEDGSPPRPAGMTESGGAMRATALLHNLPQPPRNEDVEKFATQITVLKVATIGIALFRIEAGNENLTPPRSLSPRV